MTKMIDSSMLIQIFKYKKIKFTVLHGYSWGIMVLDNALLIQALSNKKEKKG